MEYRGYRARVEFDQDAAILHGEVEGLRDVITFEAEDVRDLEAAFREAVDDYLIQCADDGVEPEKPYSGKFLLRVDPGMHREIALAAARAGRSLNAFANDVFRSWLGHVHPSDRIHEQSSIDEDSANATGASEVTLFSVPVVPAAVATPGIDSPVWRDATRITPGYITPNTPASNHSSNVRSKRHLAKKAAKQRAA